MSKYKNVLATLTGLALLVTSIGGIPQYASAAPGCTEDSVNLVSDTSVMAGTNPAVPTYVHPAWTASIPGATWIWESAFVANPSATTTVSFTKQFTVNDEINSATLNIAVDNSYVVYVNGTPVASSTAITYNAPDTINLSSYVNEGSNTLRIDVTNNAMAGASATDNPAGLLFGLNVNAGSCDGPESGKAHLQIIKTVVGGSATSSSFMINVAGVGVSTSTATSTATSLSISGSGTGTTLTLSPGSYNVTETAASGFNVDYSANCSGTIAAGQTRTCTITNTAIPQNPTRGTLTVYTNVTNDNGGTSGPSNFQITVSGSAGVATSSSGASSGFQNSSGSGSGTTFYLDPGTYSVIVGSQNGYNISYSGNCSGTIAAGESRTCIISANDIGTSGGGTGTTTTGGGNVNVNVNPNINPNITVNPVFNNVSGGGFLFPGFIDFFGGNLGSVLGAATTTLSCGPSSRTVATGQLTTFSATGGNGNYVWTAPQMAPRSGNTLTVFYTSPGNSSVTVTSGSQTATCNVTITGSVLGDTTPGLPNTGLGGNMTLLLNMGVVLALSGITTMIVRKRVAR